MPETIDLGNGETAEVRSELTGADQRWYFIQRDLLTKSNGTGRPARREVDPDNSAQMRDVPAVPAEWTVEDNFTMLDMLAGRLLVSSTMPGIVPWRVPSPGQPGTRDDLDLDVVDAVDNGITPQLRRLQGIASPKRPKSGGNSATTSADEAPAQPDSTAETSSTPPG